MRGTSKRGGNKRKLAPAAHPTSESDFRPSGSSVTDETPPTPPPIGTKRRRRRPPKKKIATEDTPEAPRSNDTEADLSAASESPRTSARLKGKVPNYAVLAGRKPGKRAKSGSNMENDDDALSDSLHDRLMADARLAELSDERERPRTSSSSLPATTSPSVQSRQTTVVNNESTMSPVPGAQPSTSGHGSVADETPANGNETKVIEFPPDETDFREGILKTFELLPAGAYVICRPLSNMPSPSMRIRSTKRDAFGPLSYPFLSDRLDELVKHGRIQKEAMDGPSWRRAKFDPTFLFPASLVEITDPSWQQYVQKQAESAVRAHGMEPDVLVIAEFHSLRFWTENSLWRNAL
jgi:hypothetical protein